MPPIIVPVIPNKLDKISNNILYPLTAFASSIDGKISPAIEEIAITIIMIGDTIPALTAASPSINPPNIDTADPAVVDIRKSVSFNISKQTIIKNASIYAGKGTKLLPAFNIISKSKERRL